MDFDSANLQYYKLLEQRQEREREANLQLREKTVAAGNLAKFHDQLLSLSTPTTAATEESSKSVSSQSSPGNS